MASIVMSTAMRRGLGLLLVVEGLLAFAPVLILGAAIGWPASLDDPAAVQLAAIAATPHAVAAGYGVYLLYSLLVLPVMAGVAGLALARLDRPWALSVVGFAALSALARAIGILRWLTVMPALAQARQADPASAASIEQLFDAINAYGGGIGELLGVSLCMALSLGLLAIAAWRSGAASGLPRGFSATALAVALLLAGLALPSLGIAIEVPMALAVSALSLWMLALGAWCLWPIPRPVDRR
jgi:hypothetical protein